MPIVLSFEYPEIPPTSNKIYIKGTMLTPVARAYAERFAFYMRSYLAELNELDERGVYAMHLRFFMKDLLNKSWNNPDVAPSKRAKSRYKKVDLSNRIKLIEDCIRDAIGIDDSQTFAATQEKHQVGPNEAERVEIDVQQVDPAVFGL